MAATSVGDSRCTVPRIIDFWYYLFQNSRMGLSRRASALLGAGVVTIAVVALGPTGVPAATGHGRPDPASRTLAAALQCSAGLRDAAREPVLLVAGTGATPLEQYSWNYEPALSALGIPWCAVTVPEHTLGDVQDDAEYFVHAIRYMYGIA